MPLAVTERPLEHCLLPKFLRVRILVLLVAVVPTILPVQAAPGTESLPPDAVPGRLIVQFRDRVSEATAQATVRSQGATEIGQPIIAGRFRVLQVPPGRETETLRRLAADPNVAYAGYDHVVSIQVAPNDPFYAQNQWDMQQTGFEDAWSISTGSPSVVVAVVDTGIDANHPEFAGRVLPGRNFSPEGSETDTIDGHGHGTHVAGILAAAGNNDIGIAGAAWKTSLLPVKVLDSTGRGKVSELVAGMEYAVQQGVKVINLSLGTPVDSPVIKAALDAAEAAGVLVVAAAGNDGARCDPSSPPGSRACNYPAAYPYAFAVAATNQFKTRASYSNFGPFVDIAAPGGDGSMQIFSTLPSVVNSFSNPTPRCAAPPCYGSMQGTSQATPHVSGLAALVVASCPDISANAIKSIIESTATDLGTPGKDDLYGHGLINAGSALRAVGAPTLQASPGSLQFIVGPDSQPAPSTVSVTTTPGKDCPQGAFTATSDQPWLLVNGATQAQATAPTTLSISIDVTQVPTNTTSTGTVQLASAGATADSSGRIVVSVESISRTVSTITLPLVGADLSLD